MGEERVQRRLAAILAADVVGYSRLMGDDEAGTLARLKELRADLIEPLIADYHGRIVKLMGDGALIEFASVVDAVECAVEIQRGVADWGADVDRDNRIAFRIGINLGDVIVEEDDIYGEGVNVAARLEGLADPDGICISGTVFDQVKDKLSLTFDDLGLQDVKNIAEPVRSYRIHSNMGSAAEKPLPQKRRPRLAAMAAIVVVAALFVGGLYAWLEGGKRVGETTPPADVAAAMVDLPDKPSIAVLAFQNMSNDPSQEYFADGIAEDIITDLSKLSALFVIARNSSFRYKGQAVDLKKVGRELGVKYILEGSVRRSGDQVRITAQLIDAGNGGHIWADRYDGELEDVFALQDRVTGRIIKNLKLQLAPSERLAVEEQGTHIPAAYDAYLRGLSLLSERRTIDIDAHGAAGAEFEKAIRIDPDYALAIAGLAWARWLSAQSSSVGSISETYELAKRSIALADNPLARRVLAKQHFSLQSWWRKTTKRKDLAVAELERARELRPNDPDVLVDLATVLSFAGRPQEALELVQQAMKFNPNHPKWYFAASGIAHLLTENPERAATHLQTWSDANPNWFLPHIFRAAALGNSGEISAAKEALARAFKLRHFELMLPAIRSGWPMAAKQEEVFFKGLRAAGARESHKP